MQRWNISSKIFLSVRIAETDEFVILSSLTPINIHYAISLMINLTN